MMQAGSIIEKPATEKFESGKSRSIQLSPQILAKEQELRRILREMESVIIAFSGALTARISLTRPPPRLATALWP